MFNSGYPTAKFEINDISGANTDALIPAPTEGLCVPFAFILAERGQPGAIHFGASRELTAHLGKSTFDPTGPYFNPATQFVGTAMAGQGVNVMRLVDPAAKVATMGLFLAVNNKNVIQYRTTPDGRRILDDNGDPLPQMQSDNVTPLTQPGIFAKWVVRKLNDDEDFDDLDVVTASVGGVEVTTYPILGVEMDSQGKYGDRQGFAFYSSPVKGSMAALALNTMLYRFQPMALPSDVSTTASPIPDFFGAQFNDVSFKASALYTPTNTNYAFRSVVDNAYVSQTEGHELLPYKLHVYGEHIGTIGNRVLALSPEILNHDPYMLDLITGRDLDDNYYDHLEISAASDAVVNPAVTLYAKGGTDGDTSWAKFESLVQDWLTGSDHGEFSNVMQHPMTHFYDPGFSMPVKTLLFNMLDLRDNIKIDVSTQDISRRPNTKAEDIAAGQALLFRAQMHPESLINGVGCSRVGIYAHTAKLVVGSGYDNIVPFTFNRLVQRRDLDGGSYIKGSAGGLPASEVTRFRKPNWVADDEGSKALSWASCINTVQHASRTRIFYASLRTVYPNDTSLLSDDEFSDRIIYMRKIAREVWATYAGVKAPAATLYPRIERDINTRCAEAFSTDSIFVNATVGQTALDANLGYQVSVNLAVSGDFPLRTMNINVEVQRTAQ